MLFIIKQKKEWWRRAICWLCANLCVLCVLRVFARTLLKNRSPCPPYSSVRAGWCGSWL